MTKQQAMPSVDILCPGPGTKHFLPAHSGRRGEREEIRGAEKQQEPSTWGQQCSSTLLLIRNQDKGSASVIYLNLLL